MSATEATRLIPTHHRAKLLPSQHHQPGCRRADFPYARRHAAGGHSRPRGGGRQFWPASDSVLHANYEAPTPTTVPGARTIRTADLADLLEQRKPLVIDTVNWGRSIPGAVGLWGAGSRWQPVRRVQDRLARKCSNSPVANGCMPIVAIGFNAERYQGRNLALRLVALGYTNVYWYRGGREAWEVAGLPEAELVMQDW